MAEAPLNINVKAVFTGKKAFKEADTATTKLAKGAGKLAGALGIAFSTRAILNYSKAAMKAAAQDQEAQAVLSQNLKNLGLAYANVDSEGFIASLERQTAILDDELRPAYAKLARVTGSIGKTQKIMKVAFDAAKGSGQSYNAVIETLSQAYVGNQKGLKKLNLGFTAAELSAMSFDEVLQVITEHFNGAGTKALEGYAGKMAKLDLASKNASETIGGALLDAFSQLAGNGDIDKATSKIDTFSKGAADLIRYLSGAKNVADAFRQVDFNLLGGLTGKGLVTDKQKNGGALGAPGAMANQTAAKKAEKAALDRAKKLAEISKKTNKAAGESLKLAKAKAVFDLQKIQIEAALKGKISDEEKARLLLLKAIENENVDDIDKYTKALKKAEDETAALQAKLDLVKSIKIADPFAAFKTGTQEAIDKVNALQAAALKAFAAQAGLSYNPGQNFDRNYDAKVAAVTSAINSGTSGSSGGTTTTVTPTVVVNVAGSVTSDTDLTTKIVEVINQQSWAGVQVAWNRASKE